MDNSVLKERERNLYSTVLDFIYSRGPGDDSGLLGIMHSCYWQFHVYNI